jgi:hypothetical protein
MKLIAGVHGAACRLVLSVQPWSGDFRGLVDHLRSIRLPELSPSFVNALVAAEDHRFWSHCGVDFRAVVRALVRFMGGRREGASTVQQQLVRVVTGRYEISIARKAREAAFAISLGKFFTRDELARQYLVHGYYGYRMSGLLAACAQLGVDARTAGPIGAAEVVARLRYPQPSVPTEAYRARVGRRVSHILMRQGLSGPMPTPTLTARPAAAGAAIAAVADGDR